MGLNELTVPGIEDQQRIDLFASIFASVHVEDLLDLCSAKVLPCGSVLCEERILRETSQVSPEPGTGWHWKPLLGPVNNLAWEQPLCPPFEQLFSSFSSDFEVTG